MSYIDATELAYHLVGLDICEDEFDVLDNALIDKYGLDSDALHRICADLLPMIDVGKSPLTDKTYKGFTNGTYFLLKVGV